MPQDFARHLRVGSELHRIINLLLQDEIKDPRLKSVRVSDVDLSGDLGVARVFYSSLDPDCDPAPIDAALAIKPASHQLERGDYGTMVSFVQIGG